MYLCVFVWIWEERVIIFLFTVGFKTHTMSTGFFNTGRGLNDSRSLQTYAAATSRHWTPHGNMKQKWTQTRAHYVDNYIGEVAYGGFNTGFINSFTLHILLCQNCLEWSVILLTSVTLVTLIRVLTIDDIVSRTGTGQKTLTGRTEQRDLHCLCILSSI